MLVEGTQVKHGIKSDHPIGHKEAAATAALPVDPLEVETIAQSTAEGHLN